MQGTIKKIVSDKGFGFIVPTDQSKDVFFHASGLQNCEFDALKEGDDVSFDIVKGDKGPRADNVVLQG